MSRADNFAFQILSGERLPIPFVLFFLHFVLELAIDEECNGYANEENHNRDEAPKDNRCCGIVACQRVIWPVVGVAVLLAWPLCRAQPATPKKECRKILDILGVADLFNSVELRPLEVFFVEPSYLLPRCHLSIVENHDVLLLIVGVAAEIRSHPHLGSLQLELRCAVTQLALVVLHHGGGGQVEGLGRVIWAPLRAIPQEAAVRHQPAQVEYLLAMRDHVRRKNDLPCLGHKITDRRYLRDGHPTIVADAGDGDGDGDEEVQAPILSVTQQRSPITVRLLGDPLV